MVFKGSTDGIWVFWVTWNILLTISIHQKIELIYKKNNRDKSIEHDYANK